MASDGDQECFSVRLYGVQEMKDKYWFSHHFTALTTPMYALRHSARRARKKPYWVLSVRCSAKSFPPCHLKKQSLLSLGGGPGLGDFQPTT